MTTSENQSAIDAAWETRAEFSPACHPADVRVLVETVIGDLNSGRIRVAEKIDGEWVTHQWIKKAVLLSFRLNDNAPIHAGDLGFFDKVQTKFANLDAAAMRATGVRVVPPAVARRGAFIGRNVVLMPSYVNIGAYVDEGTMVDTWATVGSCAQIGKNVHLSGGVGIGGVLEPIQANPTIIEDNCFIGARSEVVEGVIIGEVSVERWVYILANRPKSTTVRPARCVTARSPPIRWSSQAIYRLKMKNTACIAPLLSKRSMPKRVQKPALTNYCALNVGVPHCRHRDPGGKLIQEKKWLFWKNYSG